MLAKVNDSLPPWNRAVPAEATMLPAIVAHERELLAGVSATMGDNRMDGFR